MDGSNGESGGAEDSHHYCSDCVLCRLSRRVHSWQTSGQRFWVSTCQKCQAGKTYVCNGLNEGASRVQERMPGVAEFIQNSGRNARAAAGTLSENSVSLFRRGTAGTRTVYNAARPPVVRMVHDSRDFVVKNTNFSFICGSILLVCGTFFYLIPASSTVLFIVMVLVGGLFIWVPICYWMREPLDPAESQSSQQQQPVVFMEKPPDYDTLSIHSNGPLLQSTARPRSFEAPPAYDDAILPGCDLMSFDIENNGASLIPSNHFENLAPVHSSVCSPHRDAAVVLSGGVAAQSQEVPSQSREVSVQFQEVPACSQRISDSAQESLPRPHLLIAQEVLGSRNGMSTQSRENPKAPTLTRSRSVGDVALVCQ